MDDIGKMKWIKARHLVLLLSLALLSCSDAGMAGSENANTNWVGLRADMVSTIARLAQQTGATSGVSTFSADVLDAMNKVPRHAFVPKAIKPYAYENRPLPIGQNQTISQPFIVALMTELLQCG